LHAREHRVSEDDAGDRLDVFLVRRLGGASRASVRRLIEAGAVRVDGRRAKKGVRVEPGQRVTLDALPEPSDFDPVPSAESALAILYEDPRFVVADKPAGMPSHPLRPSEEGTAASALVARYPEMIGIGKKRREAGLVHRLDNGTSGALLAARDEKTLATLRSALREGRIDKEYVALCAGEVRAPLAIDEPLASDPKNARRVVAAIGGRPSRTDVASVETVGSFTLVTVHAPRASRHQVRAHLAHVGHPLAGDALYGGPAVEGLERHFLHASAIALSDPEDGRPVRVSSPLPADLTALLDRIRAGA
jgi:23S rRNA pseudouridine1911/1915/1917 synthase